MKALQRRLAIDLNYFFRSGSWMLLQQVAVALIGMLLLALLARILTQRAFGEYSLVLSIVTLASVATLPGIATYLMREAARGRYGAYHAGVSLGVRAGAITSLALALAALYYWWTGRPVLAGGVAVGAITLPAIYGANKWVALLVGKERFRSLAIRTILLMSVSTAAALIGGYFFGVVGALTGYLGVQAGMHVLFHLTTRTEATNNILSPRWIRSSMELTFSGIIILVFDYADRLLVGVLLNPEALAVYTVAAVITVQLRLLLKEVMKIALPRLSAARTGDLFSAKTGWVILAAFVLSTGAAFLLIWLMPTLIPILFTAAYAASVPYAQAYLLTLPFATVGVGLSYALIAAGKERQLFVFQGLGLLVALLLYVLLIPVIALWGAVIASAAYFVVSTSLLLVSFLRTTKAMHINNV